MVFELGEDVVFDMGSAILHLHAGCRIEDVHPIHTVLLRRYFSRREQRGKRAGGGLGPLNTGVAEKDEVLRPNMLIDPASVVVDQLPGRISDLKIGSGRSDSGNGDRRRRSKYSVDEGEG